MKLGPSLLLQYPASRGFFSDPPWGWLSGGSEKNLCSQGIITIFLTFFHWLRIIACKMSFYYVEQDDNICDQEGINLQDSFMRKKLALLSSGSAPCLHRMKGKEEMQEGW